MKLNNILTLLAGITSPFHRHRFLALSLIALHFSVFYGLHSTSSASFFLVHFGLFLIWQPLWQQATDIRFRGLVTLLIGGVALLILPSQLVLTVWLLVLIGLVGGQESGTRKNRRINLISIGVLFLILLLEAMPALLATKLGNPILTQFTHYTILALCLLVFTLPVSEPQEKEEHIDYLRSVSATLIASLLAVGSALWMYRSGVNYPVALFQSLFFIAGLIILMNWLWSSQSGASIFQQLWNRYLLNLGTPFEAFLLSLSDKAMERGPASDFLEFALNKLLELEWLAGVSWESEKETIQLGIKQACATHFAEEDLHVVVYTSQKIGPAFELHIKLLVYLVYHFYEAQLYSEQLEQHARIEAIHQTGARLTHDMKNLLQAVQYLSEIVSTSTADQSDELLMLLKRQLPELSNRMQLTIEKLKAPGHRDKTETRARVWWQVLQDRYSHRGISFEPVGTELDGVSLPKELFDSVAENLLENAVYKRKLDRDVAIKVTLCVEQGQAILRVWDSGIPIPPETEKNLFHHSVRSSSGLGVGLYQSQRLAEQNAYTLHIVFNRPGNVLIEVRPRS